MNKTIKPFLKWAGGKKQLLPILLENFDYNCKKYVEAFVGGGALFLAILDNIEKFNIEKIVVNDINEKLIILYKVIRDNVDLLIKELKKIEEEYNSLFSIEEKEKMYYSIREEFNTSTNDPLKLGRNFIFLNKTCFNGLYRENAKGHFNVPFGKKDKVILLNEENLKTISIKLNYKKNRKRIVEFRNDNFIFLENEINKDTFFYFDPPYRPVTKNGFNDYNKSSFNDAEQIELSKFCDKIAVKHGKFLLSNSDPKNLDENDNFFDDLYSKYLISRVNARRNINSKGNGRGEITEILVKNFEVNKNDIKTNTVSVQNKLFESELDERNEMEKEFKIFLSQLKETNATLSYFVDFEKVTKNVEKISLKLNQLNYLLGKSDLKKAVNEIYEENPKAFEVLNILIAVRDSKKTKVIVENNYYSLNNFFDSPDKIYKFIKLTNLEKIFQDKTIKNLVDYVYGIEVGLDSNSRKNRGGENMSNIIKEIFTSNNIPFSTEVSSTTYPELSISLGEDIKKFDYVIQTTKKIYLIEINFYSTGGSKLNEVARAYTDIAPKVNKNEKFEFVWITDGVGWLNAKNKLQEAYINIPKIYNLTTIEKFIKILKEEL